MPTCTNWTDYDPIVKPPDVGLDQLNWMLVVLGVVASAAYVCSRLAKALSFARRNLVRGAGNWSKCWSARSAPSGFSVADVLRVRKVADGYRIRRAKTTFKYSMVLSFVIVGMELYWFLVNPASDYQSDSLAYRSTFVPSLLYLVGGLVLEVRPRLFTPCSLDCINFLVATSMMMICLFWEPPIDSNRLHRFANSVMYPVWSFIQFGNVRLCTILQVAWFTTIWVTGFAWKVGNSNPDWGVFFDWFLTWENNALYIALGMSLAVMWLMEGAAESEATAVVAASKSKGTESLVMKLLSGMCDAVVQLSDNLEIQGPSEELHALLLHRNTSGTLRGRPLLSLFPASERSRVTTFFETQRLITARGVDDMIGPEGESSRRSQCMALLHTNMLDAASLAVPVQLFYASFGDEVERMHIVGIKHDADEGRQDLEAPSDLPGVHLPVPERSVEEPSAGDDRSESVSSAESVEGDPALAVSFHIGEPEYPIIQSTRAFDMQMGTGDGCRKIKLLDWIDREQRDAFVSWAQQIYMLEHATPEEPPPLRMRVCLRPPRLRQFHIRLYTTVELDQSPVPGSSANCDGAVLRVTLHDLEWMHRDSRRRNPKDRKARGADGTPRSARNSPLISALSSHRASL